MGQIIIEEIYQLPDFTKVTREYSGDSFDIVFYNKGKEVMRINDIPNDEIDRYVFASTDIQFDDSPAPTQVEIQPNIGWSWEAE